MFRNFLLQTNSKIGSDWSIRKFGLEMNEFIKEGDYITRIKKSGKNYYSIDCIKAIERFNIHNEPDNNEYCIDSD